MKYKAAIFDMDGTILNTLDDLTATVNYTMEKFGHQAGYPNEKARELFGSGVEIAVKRALALEAGMPLEELEQIGTEGYETVPGVDEEEVARMLLVYKPYYAEHCNDQTRPYPGIMELIRRLREAGVVCAVVSNKPDGAVQVLAEKYFPGVFDFVLGEKASIARKPAADMCEYALKMLQIEKEDAVYIGDSEIDLQTAENCGLNCISVPWGFRSKEFLENHGARVIAESTGEVAELILG